MYVVDRAEYNQTGTWTCIYQESRKQHVYCIDTEERIQVSGVSRTIFLTRFVLLIKLIHT